MKQLETTKIEKNKLSAFPSVLLVSLILLLTIILPNFVQAQQKSELSLADVIIALRSNKVTLAERNEILKGAVEERGITFEISPQIEKELENTGANKTLIDAIRKKGVVVKTAATTQPKSVEPATPAPVEKDFAYYKKAADDNFSKGEFDFALANYNKAVELSTADSMIYVNRGVTFHKKKDYEKAIADFSKAIELNPSEVTAFSNRAVSFEKNGDEEKAVADYKKVIELDGKNDWASNNLKRIEDEKAKILQKQKEQDAALAEAEKLKAEKEIKKAEPIAPVKVETNGVSEIMDLGLLNNSMAVEMVKPVYPQSARSMNLQGKITVQVLIDEKGNVTSAETTEGSRLLRDAAEQAAIRSKFKPAMVGDKAVKAKGYIVYSFVR